MKTITYLRKGESCYQKVHDCQVEIVVSMLKKQRVVSKIKIS